MSPLHPAPDQLADFAAASRPDWERDRIDGAVLAARTNGVPWPRFLGIFWAALTDDNGSPHDILAAIRDPLDRSAPAEPTAEYLAARDSLTGAQASAGDAP